MKKKEKLVKEEYKFVRISESDSCYEMLPIPEGATHVETEIDYSNCYYESDQPSVKVIFCRKEKIS